MSDDAPREDTVTAREAPREPTADEMMAECVAVQSEGRRWLKSITAFVAARKSEPDDSKMVQVASDAAMAAAYDRAARILRSDDPIGD